MRIRTISFLALIGIALVSLLAAWPVLAHNPIAVTSTGVAYKWNQFPITYTVDGGMLGSLSNLDANALTMEAFTAWTSVATASLSVSQNPVIGLGSDGDIDTVAEFNALFPSGPCPNLNAIIYDSGGTLTDGLFGAGASNNLLGFASPCLSSAGDSILAMRAVLIIKGLTAGTVTPLFRSGILGVFIHEFGHGLGLGHSQVNLNCQINAPSCPSNTPGGDLFGLPTMYPFLLSRTETTDVNFQTTLSADDVSAISTLYPSPAFAASFGTISGTVFFGDNINHFQGANVIARRVGDPRVTAVSNVSGMFAQVNHGNPALGRLPSPFGSPNPLRRGAYAIPGLPPGTYTVEVENVSPTFLGGSSVGPVGPQRGENFSLASAECLGGPESNTDNTAICQNLVLSAGNILTNNNFILNDTLATMDSFDTAARNETIATATQLVGGANTTVSISGNNDSDVDFYAISVPAGLVLSVDASASHAQGMVDPVIDLMDANGVRLQNCRIGGIPTAFDRPCVNDDFVRAGALTLDSNLVYLAPAAGTIYLRVTDALGDFRPDFRYQLVMVTSAPQPGVGFSSTQLNFGSLFINSLSPVQSADVINAGSADLTLSGSNPVSITNVLGGGNPFSLASGGTCVAGMVLVPGASCFVNVTFQPLTVGQFTGNLSIASNASPNSLQLRGQAIDFTFTSGSNSSQVAAGSSADFILNFAIVVNSTGLPNTTAFSVSGLPTGANATFNPATLATFTLSTPVTMTVTTTRRAMLLPPRLLPLPVPVGYPAMLVAVTLLLASLTWARLSIGVPKWIHRSALIALLCIFASFQACSGGGGGANGGGAGAAAGGTGTTPNPNGTPAGTYPLTVTATSGSATRTTTVTLTVQ